MRKEPSRRNELFSLYCGVMQQKGSYGAMTYKVLGIGSKWSCIIIAISIVFLVGAISLFFVYYQYTMPPIFTIAQPLYFDYQHPSHQLEEHTPNINVHYHIDNPEFYIPKNPGRGTLPTATFVLPPSLLDTRSAYSFTIHFKFADSPVNRQIGMFMIRMNLRNVEGSILSTASRPAIVPHRPYLQRLIREIILLIPSLLGIYEEMYQITVPCINYFWDESADPLHSVQISLSHPDIQLYKSTLYIGTQLFGISYALHHYFVFTAFMFIVGFFVMEWMMLICAIGLYFVRSQKKTKRRWDSNDICIERVDEIVSPVQPRRFVRVKEEVSEDLSNSKKNEMEETLMEKNQDMGLGDAEFSESGKTLLESEFDELDEAIDSPSPVEPPTIIDQDTLIEEAPKKLRKRPRYVNRTPAQVVDIDRLPIDSPNKPLIP